MGPAGLKSRQNLVPFGCCRGESVPCICCIPKAACISSFWRLTVVSLNLCIHNHISSDSDTPAPSDKDSCGYMGPNKIISPFQKSYSDQQSLFYHVG